MNLIKIHKMHIYAVLFNLFTILKSNLQKKIVRNFTNNYSLLIGWILILGNFVIVLFNHNKKCINNFNILKCVDTLFLIWFGDSTYSSSQRKSHDNNKIYINYKMYLYYKQRLTTITDKTQLAVFSNKILNNKFLLYTWRPPSLSELTPYWLSLGLTNLGSG